MNNELFDSLIREQLAQQAVMPTAAVKKALAKKLFFQNLWVFHKLKLMIGFVGVAAVSCLAVYVSADQAVIKDAVATNRIFPTIGIHETTANTTAVNVLHWNNNKQKGINKSIPAPSNPIPSAITENTAAVNPLSSTDLNSVKEEEIGVINSHEKATKTELASNENTSTDQKITNKKPSKTGELNIVNTNLVFENNQLNKPFVAPANPLSYTQPLAPTALPTEIVLKIDTSKVESGKGDFYKPLVYQELSFDAFSIVQNNGLLKNEMLNETYKNFYWDFYADQVTRKMPTSFGLGVNYAVGTYRHKILFSSGLNYTKIEESKTKYDLNIVTDQAWLDVFNVNELSWVNTYGQDTCTTCFYAHNTDALKEEIQQDYNKYTYVNIPLNLGYQLNLGMLSVALKGGVQTAILAKSKGLYVTQKDHIQGERLYFWKGVEMTTLEKNNDMLKKVHVSFNLGSDIRLRLTSKIDLLLGYTFNKTIGTLSNADYIYNKSYTNHCFLVGLSFFPNRIPMIRNLNF